MVAEPDNDGVVEMGFSSFCNRICFPFSAVQLILFSTLPLSQSFFLFQMAKVFHNKVSHCLFSVTNKKLGKIRNHSYLIPPLFFFNATCCLCCFESKTCSAACGRGRYDRNVAMSPQQPMKDSFDLAGQWWWFFGSDKLTPLSANTTTKARATNWQAGARYTSSGLCVPFFVA